MITVLELVFLTDANKKKTITIRNPKEGITGAQAHAAMDAILAANPFAVGLAAKVEARLKGTEVTVLENEGA